MIYREYVDSLFTVVFTFFVIVSIISFTGVWDTVDFFYYGMFILYVGSWPLWFFFMYTCFLMYNKLFEGGNPYRHNIRVINTILFIYLILTIPFGRFIAAKLSVS